MNKKVSVIFSVLSIFLLITSIFSNLFVNNEAIFCGDLGPGTASKISRVQSNELSFPNVGSRTYTIVELFSSSFDYAIPNGQLTDDNKGVNTILKSENTIVKDKVKDLDEEAEKRLQNLGSNKNFIQCSFAAPLEVFWQDIGSDMSQGLSNLISIIVVSLFNDDFICKDPAKPSGACINLLGIIGGKTSSDKTGIISTLGNSFFLPLTIVAFISVGVWLLWTAIIKRQFRFGLQGTLWAFFAFALGIIVIYNPFLVARAPQAINSIVSDCLLSVLGGASCGQSDEAILKDTISNVCESKSSEQLSSGSSIGLKVNSLTCSIVKAFTIDRWSYLQFGYTFDELWTVDPPSGYEVYSKIQGDPTDYCVAMSSTQSPSKMNTQTPKTNGDKKCNIALAYVAVKTQGNFGVKASMEQIIATAAHDDTMWSSFTGNGRSFMSYFFVIIAIIIAGISFIPITLYAHIYSFTATILMAFAPIYLLFAIHPGKGRRIFLGWLETVVGNILKYAASAMLVLVMILVYGSVFAKLGQFQLLIASLVLSSTFISYRKEFTNMIGAVNMGGQKVRNMAEERLNKVKHSAGQTSKAIAGGAIGGMAAGISENGITGGFKNAAEAAKANWNKNNNKNIVTRAIGAGVAATGESSTLKGAAQGLGMELKRGNGFVATAARQASMTKRELQSDRRAKEQLSENMLEADKRQTQATQSKVMNNPAYSNTANAYKEIDQLDMANDIQNSIQDTIKPGQTHQEVVEAHNKLDIKTDRSIRLFNEINKTGDIDKGLQEFARQEFSSRESRATTPNAELEKNISNANSHIPQDLLDKTKFLQERILDKNINTLDNMTSAIKYSNTENGISAQQLHSAINYADKELDNNNKMNRIVKDSFNVINKDDVDTSSKEYKQAINNIEKLAFENDYYKNKPISENTTQYNHVVEKNTLPLDEVKPLKEKVVKNNVENIISIDVDKAGQFNISQSDIDNLIKGQEVQNKDLRDKLNAFASAKPKIEEDIIKEYSKTTKESKIFSKENVQETITKVTKEEQTNSKGNIRKDIFKDNETNSKEDIKKSIFKDKKDDFKGPFSKK